MPLVENQVLDRRSVEDGQIPAGVPAELLKRAALLLEPDRALVHMSFKANATRHMIACALGLAPGTITRRLQRIGARLHDPLVVALLDRTCPLVSEYRQIGIEHFLQGLSTHAIGEKHRMSHDRVRRMLQAVRLWHESGVRPVDPWKKELKPARHRRRRATVRPTPAGSAAAPAHLAAALAPRVGDVG